MKYYTTKEFVKVYLIAIATFTLYYGLCIWADGYGKKHFPMSRFIKSK